MTTAIGGYELESELGHGATGTVYVARPAAGGEPVALKVLSPALASDPAFRARFRREAEVMKRLADPHCVGVYDYGDDDTPWIAMEYVHGATLRAVLDRADKLTPAQACGVMLGALAGLGHAHDLGVVHRDVKPDNVLVDAHGESKLADFGLVADRVEVNDWRAIEGSPAYMSPEQVRGGPLDARSDLYACGAVLYELLTGHAPYSAESPIAMLHAQVDAPTPNTTSLPSRIAAVVTRALAKDPNARPASAAEFAAELTDAADRDLGPLWLAGAGLAGLVTGVLGVDHVAADASAPRRRPRSRARLAVAAAGVVTVVAAAAVAVGALDHTPKKRSAATTAAATPRSTSASSTSPPPTTAVAVVDSCLVGRWSSTTAISTGIVTSFNGPSGSLLGGIGIVRTIQADGHERFDYSHATPFALGAERIGVTGSSTDAITARHGNEALIAKSSVSRVQSHVISQVQGAVGVGFMPPYPAFGRVTYACHADGFTEHSANGTVAWRRA